MLVFKKQVDLIAHLKTISSLKTTIGFVPTMGALHQGHLSLIKESILNNNITVVSIFVNPTQFNNSEDLTNYPRTLEEDLIKIKNVSDKVITYTPDVDDIYEGTTQSQHFDYDGLEFQMEGKFRPGHFDGVGTIVKRLFEIVKPTNAYFGEKDFQQLQIIKKLVDKQNIPVHVIGCPIYREANGLAMSSRNERLTNSEKQTAAVIYETIQQVKTQFKTNSAIAISKWVNQKFKKIPDFTLEYFQIADEATLTPCLRKNKNKNYRAFIAVYVNNIRLIDTISLN